MVEHPLLLVAKVAVLLLGSSVAALALIAHRRNPDRLMALLGVGFGLMAVGSFVEGILFEILDWDLFSVHIIESVFVLAGLGTIAVLLRPRWSRG